MKPQFNSQDVEIIQEEILYRGHLKLLKYHLRFKLFTGEWSTKTILECFKAHDAVGVLLFDPIRDEIVLTEQFRIGALDSPNSPWLLELVAGVIEPQESMIDVAKRETIEEAGCEIIDLVHICDYYTSPGISTAKFTLFCGRITKAHQGGIFGLEEEHENIRTHVFPTQKVYSLLDEGKINNAPTIIALQWFKMNEEKVRNLWQ